MPANTRAFLPLLAWILLPLCGGLQAAPLPVKYLTELPAIDHPCVSPNGKWLALAHLIEGRQVVSVLDLGTMKPLPIGSLGFSQVANLWWKNDQWLLMLVQNPDGAREFQSIEFPSLKVRKVFGANQQFSTKVVHLLPDDPDEVLVSARLNYLNSALRRMNLRTSRLRSADYPAAECYVNWMANASGTALGGLGVSTTDFESVFFIWRKDLKSDWQRTAIGRNYTTGLRPLGVAPDGRHFLTLDLTMPNQAEIVEYDPVDQAKKTILSAEEADSADLVEWNQYLGTPRGIAYGTDRRRIHFFDHADAALQSSIDQSLPDSQNEIVSQSHDRRISIVQSHSETTADTYYLLDSANKRLARLGAQYPELPGLGLTGSRRIDFPARDGLTLHGRITLPAGPGSSKPPLILMTGYYTNGPHARPQFDAQVHLLVSRGYAVAQVDPRGTIGYGRGYAMPAEGNPLEIAANDLIDGAKWIAAQGLVDPDKVILFGRYAGGWAGVTALAQSDVFAGWINWEIPLRLIYVKAETGTRHLVSAHSEALSLGGSIFAIERFARTHAPTRLLARIKVPSFHHYDFNSWDADQVKDHYGKTPGHVVSQPKENSTVEEDNAEIRANQERLLKFLADHFPVAVPMR